MKADLGQIAETFIQTVMENRPKAAGSKDKWSKGGMFYATEAKKLGLIDGIKSFDEIVGRVSALASSNKKSKNNKMSAGAFQNTLAAANAEAFDVVENGFLLSEEQLNSIETHIASSAQAAADSQAAQQQLQESLDAANTAAQESEIAFNNLNTTIEAREARIAELEAEVAALNAATPPPAGTSKPDDSFGADPNAKYLTSVDEEMAQIRKLRNS